MRKNNSILFLISVAILSTASCLHDFKATNDFPLLTGEYLGQKPPGTTPMLFAHDIISTIEYNDRDLTISPDGTQLFFSRTKTGNNEDYDYDIFYSEIKNGVWTKPEKAWFCSEYGEVEPFFTQDGKQLFFNSNRPQNNTTKTGHWETWVITKIGDKWSEPQMLKAPFSRVCHTTFTKDKMYYTKEDIPALFFANYNDGTFGKPVKLDTIINSANTIYNSFIATDESYLIFTKMIDDNMKNGDLFISFKDRTGKWNSPINMGNLINTKRHETCPNVSSDGKYFFFSSDKRGNFDIYWVSIKYLENLGTKKLK